MPPSIMDGIDVYACKNAFIDLLDSSLRAALDGFAAEYAAARSIQRVFRGFRVRRMLDELSWYASQIQRIIRGHFGRKQVRFLLDSRFQVKVGAKAAFGAVCLQRIYKGYYSRKYVKDFYARKRYLEEIARKNEEMRKLMDEQLKQQIEKELRQREEQARQEFEKAATGLHHLVSTRAIPGVYNPPWAAANASQFSDASSSPSKAAVPSAFGMPIEDHLRLATARHLRTHGVHQPIKGRTTLLGNTAIPVPSYINSDKQTLQAAAPYDLPTETEKTAARISKLMEIDNKAFHAGGRTTILEEPAGPTANATAPFEDFVRASRMTRDFENAPETKAKRVTAIPFINTAYQRTGQLFEEKERERADVAAIIASNSPRRTLNSAAMRRTLSAVRAVGPGTTMATTELPPVARRPRTISSARRHRGEPLQEETKYDGYDDDNLATNGPISARMPASRYGSLLVVPPSPSTAAAHPGSTGDPFLSGEYEDSLDQLQLPNIRTNGQASNLGELTIRGSTSPRTGSTVPSDATRRGLPPTGAAAKPSKAAAGITTAAMKGVPPIPNATVAATRRAGGGTSVVAAAGRRTLGAGF